MKLKTFKKDLKRLKEIISNMLYRMPQKDKSQRQEYNKQQYLKRKSTQEIPDAKEPNNYYLLKFFKNIQEVNKTFVSVKLKPIVANIKQDIINELTTYQIKNKNKFESFKIKYDYIMIDFIRFMKYKLYIEETDEPEYNGKCYNFKWIKKLHKKISDYNYSKYFDIKKRLDIYSWKKYKVVEEYYKKECPNYKDKKELENWQSKYNGRYMKILTDYLNNYKDKPNELNILKIRKVYKTMNYLKTPKYHYDATNIKFFDKETKKPSNTGLQADKSYVYNDDETNHLKGWKFNGITVDEIKIFCHNNGLDKKLSKNYKYGDYANWILKQLN